MRNLLSRLGVVGISIIVAALIFGVLAGGVIVHRLETSPAANSEQQGENSDRQDQGKSSSKTPRPTESPDPQEND